MYCLELEMIDEAKERLNSHPQNELLKIRAYLDLKNLGKNYPLELFLLDNKKGCEVVRPEGVEPPTLRSEV